MAIVQTTLLELITLVRQRTNIEVSQIVTNAEITTYLNNSLAMLDTHLVNQFNDYKITAVLETVAANTNTFALPNDFLRMRGLDVWYDLSTADGYRSLREHDFSERNRKAYTGSTLTYGPTNMTYRLQGQTVLLLPAAVAANWTYRLWYTPQFIPLVNTTDTLQSYMDGQFWSEYAVVDTAVKVLAKQDQDPSIFMAQANEIKEYIVKLAIQPRNSGEPKCIVNSSREELNDGIGGYGWNW